LSGRAKRLFRAERNYNVGVAFERIAEQRLRQAIQDGWLDDLTNRGERIDLEEYFSTPEDVRMAYSVLKNANCLPEEVELRNEIARLQHALASASAADRPRMQQAVADRTLRLNVLIERNTRKRR
jgi:hypothetical protein